MKKVFSVILIMVLILNFLPVFSASTLPFSDEDYLRMDFGSKDYGKYVRDSINNNGNEWPEGTKAIEWESTIGPKNILTNKPVKVPRDIEIIGDYCFTNRSDIKDDVIDFDTLTELRYIGKSAFRDTKVKRVDLSKTKVVKIDEHGFYAESISTFIAPPTLKYIGDYAFGRRCNIEFVELNEGLEHIGSYAFVLFKGKLVIPSTVKYIGYAAMNNANVYVHRGSYAEQWCKDNNQKFYYVEEKESVAEKPVEEEIPHIKHRVGPLMIEGYYTHFVSEQEFIDGSKELYYTVNATPGAVIETVYDGEEVYYTPVMAWRIDGENELQTAKADKTSFLGIKKGNASLYEYGVTVEPTQRLDKGWKKGVRWTLDEPKIYAGKDHNFLVEYDGNFYRYKISVGWGKNYEEVRRNPAYNKMGFDKGTKIESATSKIIVDGKEYSAESYNFYGNNYFRLRDIAMFVSGSNKQFEVTYDNEKKAINLITNKPYTSVGNELKSGDGQVKLSFSACPSPVYCDGKEVLMRTRLIEGTNYIMLRDLGEIIDFEILWDDTAKCIVINTNKGYTKN